MSLASNWAQPARHSCENKLPVKTNCLSPDLSLKVNVAHLDVVKLKAFIHPATRFAGHSLLPRLNGHRLELRIRITHQRRAGTSHLSLRGLCNEAPRFESMTHKVDLPRQNCTIRQFSKFCVWVGFAQFQFLAVLTNCLSRAITAPIAHKTINPDNSE